MTPTTSGESVGQAQPLAEFFQLSFPLEQKFETYSSHMDHDLPNYGNNIPLRPYTGETANTTPQPTVQSSDCGFTNNSRLYCYDGHSGYDIPLAQLPASPTAYAAHAAKIVEVGYDASGYGNYVILQDKYNTTFYSRYGHLSSVSVSTPTYVARGQKIGITGTTGASTARHLHFDLPMNYFTSRMLIDPYGWFSLYPDPLPGSVHDLKWASGYPPTNPTTDPVNWNEGTIIIGAYTGKNRGVGTVYPIGAPTPTSQEDPIEAWWTNNYGSPGVATRGEYSDPRGLCEDFEGGTYCTDGSYRTVSINNRAFSDTPYTHWAHRYTGWAYRERVMVGYDDGVNGQYPCQSAGVPSPCFLPDQPITRAEFATVMVGGFEIPPDTSGGPHYCDVSTSHWAYTAIETLYNKQIMQGNVVGSCRYFYPGTNIKRGEMSKVIVTFGQYKQWIAALDTSGGPDYCDVGNENAPPDIHCPLTGYKQWYGFVETLYNYGIIQSRREFQGPNSYGGPGEGGLFKPGLYASRAQIAMFFHELVYAPVRKYR